MLQRIKVVDNFARSRTKSVYKCAERRAVMCRMTVQIYNRKKRLSRVFVKFFYIIFSPLIKPFNNHPFSATMKIEKKSLYLRGFNY